MAVTPKSIRKKRTQKKKPGLPFPNYLFLEGEDPVVCTCVYDGSSFYVDSASDIRMLHFNGSFGRSTLTLRTPLGHHNYNYQQQPYFQKSQLGPKVLVVDEYEVPVNSLAAESGEGKEEEEPVMKKAKMSSEEDGGNEDRSDDASPGGEEKEEGGKVILGEERKRDCFEDREEERLELMPEEAMFLSFAVGCLKIVNEEGDQIGWDQLWDLLVEKNPEFPIFYAVYHHFRCKNWVPKSGINYGGDYVLYEAGPELYHSLYIVHILGLPSRPRPLFLEICALQRCASQASKYALFCEVKMTENFVPKSPKSIFELKIQEMPVYRWAPHLYDK